MVKCYSRSEFVFDKCIGYCKNNSKDTNICFDCESLRSKMAERTKIVMKLRQEMKNDTTDTINIPSTSPRDDLKTDQNTFDSSSEFVSDKCTGYCKNNSNDTNLCFECYWLVAEEDQQRKKVIIDSFKSRIAERTKIVMKLRKEMEEKKKQRQQRLKVYTLGSGLLCSVKNCRNRLSKNLSLFGYPKDLNLRIKWMEKCGLKKDPAKIVINAERVCSIHFEDDCFKNIKLRNRLKPGSIPSLYLEDDTTDTINIPSTSPRDDLKTDQNTFDSSSEFVSDKCTGYCKNNSNDTNLCFECYWLVAEEDQQRKKVIIDSFKSRIAERTKIVMKLRKEMEEKKKQRQH